MPVREFGLDAAGRSIRLSWNGDYWNDLTVLVDGNIVGRVPDLEELESGKKIILKDGTVLWVQVVGTTLQVMSNERPLSGGHFMPRIWIIRRIRKQRKTLAMNDSTQGNWVISKIKNSKVAAIFSKTILCRVGIHQGTWTTEGRSGCLQRRFCMYCGILQPRMRHVWTAYKSNNYFEEGSCQTMTTCWRCGKTKFTGIHHEGIKSFWDWHCQRCGELLVDPDWSDLGH